MTKKQVKVKEMIERIFGEWWKKNDMGEKIDNMLFWGEPLVLNKKTGEWSNVLPVNKKKNERQG